MIWPWKQSFQKFVSFMSSGSPLALYSENNKHGTGVMLPAGNSTANAQTFFSLSLMELSALHQTQELLWHQTCRACEGGAVKILPEIHFP